MINNNMDNIELDFEKIKPEHYDEDSKILRPYYTFVSPTELDPDTNKKALEDEYSSSKSGVIDQDDNYFSDLYDQVTSREEHGLSDDEYIPHR